MGMYEPQNDLTLDPHDWDELHDLAHRMVDDMFAYLQNVGERPVWQPVSPEIANSLNEPIPWEPQGAPQAYQDFKDKVLPYPMGNIHPRFWGWYMGNGTMLGALADFLAATMNSNMGGGNHAAILVEKQVIDWCKLITGLPSDSSGLLTSGGSMANFIGLAVARNASADRDIRQEGLSSLATRLIFYGSVETHSCVQKAIELLGLGNQSYRRIAVNHKFQIDMTALAQAIQDDQKNGYLPACIIGNAGTVNTGSIDDLVGLADLCEREGLWFHVDGAIGALAALAPENATLVKGLDRADSIAMDLHKWLHIPFEAGVALVRSEVNHRRTFSLTPEYLAHSERGISGGALWFSDYGLQLTRGFRALKVWLSVKEHGLRKYGQLIDQNIAQAHYLEKLVNAAPELELMAPVVLNIVCFRYNPGGMETEFLNRLNTELLLRLQESGLAAPSSTILNGVYCIRAAISNHRTRLEDLRLLAEEVVKIGSDLVRMQ
jgi:glutamate/tyrosine decarboxylase-like PLP-dependent enzyme